MELKCGVTVSASVCVCAYLCVCVNTQAWFHSLATEVTENNIAVTVVCPGPVLSNVIAAAFTGKSGEVRRTGYVCT